ncbi:MAG TPA: YceI family protein [Gemmatimonadales bacterium]
MLLSIAMATLTMVTAPPAVLPAPVRWVVAAEGNEARYRIREQLAGFDFPNDAVGATPGVTGGISFDDKGQIVPAESKFTVDVVQLKSDRERRDGYVQRRTLETATYPTVVFVPRSAKGLPAQLPASGRVTFELTGDLTVKAVTAPVTWQVTMTVSGGTAAGSAVTKFTFADFGMTKPSVAAVLSVEDTITLEYDFRLERK